MAWIITKYLITAGLVVFISEIAKRSDKLGGFIAALPLITLLTLIWLYIEKQSDEKIANHAYYTFWYVIPTLPPNCQVKRVFVALFLFVTSNIPSLRSCLNGLCCAPPEIST